MLDINDEINDWTKGVKSVFDLRWTLTTESIHLSLKLAKIWQVLGRWPGKCSKKYSHEFWYTLADNDAFYLIFIHLSLKFAKNWKVLGRWPCKWSKEYYN